MCSQPSTATLLLFRLSRFSPHHHLFCVLSTFSSLLSKPRISLSLSLLFLSQRFFFLSLSQPSPLMMLCSSPLYSFISKPFRHLLSLSLSTLFIFRFLFVLSKFKLQPNLYISFDLHGLFGRKPSLAALYLREEIPVHEMAE